MNKFRTFFLSLLISAISAVPALADEAFVIDRFQTDIQIHENSMLTVEETIEADFSQERHGIFRDIPTDGISINVLGVTDDEGESHIYQIQDFYEGVRIQIGDPDKYISGKQTYKITYQVKKAIQYFADHDELYWNATGNAWPTEIKEAVVTVELPKTDSRIGQHLFKCYTGEVYSTGEDCKYTYDLGENSVTFKTEKALPAYSGMTIAVALQQGSITRPAVLEVRSSPNGADVYLNDQFTCKTACYKDTLSTGKYDIVVKKFGHKPPETRSVQLESGKSTIESFILESYFWYDLLIFSLVLLALAIALEPVCTFWRKGRDPRGRGVLVPQYEPPDGLSPAEMGTLIDETVHMRDLTSTIVDLAVRGYLVIKVLPDAKGLIFKKDDYELIKIDPPRRTKIEVRRELSGFDIKFIDAVFGAKQKVKISDLENEFYTELPKLKKILYESLAKKEYFPKSPSAIRSGYAIKGILLIIFGPIFMSLGFAFFKTGLLAALPVNGALSLIFAYFMPRKTAKGVTAREHILGFKHYMEIAEKDRLKFQEKENIFYKYLPYAMTLKIADKWSKAFKDIFKEPPEWYQGAGAGHFYPSAFVHNINGMSASVGAAFASRPGGGGGGSGFSGGFSGGGGGGGGGGSW